MVYEETTKKICHDLTDIGKAAYQELIAKEADKMLVEAEHKVLTFFVKLFNAIGFTETFIQERYDNLLQEIMQDRQ